MTFTIDNARALGGVVFLLALAWLLSEGKTRFPLRVFAGASALLAILTATLLLMPGIGQVMLSLNGIIDALQNATKAGAAFVFGSIGGGAPPYQVINPFAPPSFAFQILPMVMVVAALSAILWHWGILRLITQGLSRVFEVFMGVGGAVGLSVAANIFMGTIEAPLVIRAYLDRLSRSELFIVMTTGLASVAGSVMVLYVTVLKSAMPDVLGHIIAASILTAPAGVLISAIMLPPNAGDVPTGRLGKMDFGYKSTMDAFASGVEEGLKVWLAIITMLLVVVALVALVNAGLAQFGDVQGAKISVERAFGLMFAPVMWLLGVPWEECLKAGHYLGVKTVLNELLAYMELGAAPAGQLSERTQIILVYSLCGFANFSSVGIMIAGLTSMAPNRRPEILELAPRSLVSGTIATLLVGAVIGAIPIELMLK